MNTPGSIVSVSFHLGTDARVTCSTYPNCGPILSLDVCGGWVSITPAGRQQITDEVLAIVRDFAEQVQRFLVECERIHALDPGQEVA